MNPREDAQLITFPQYIAEIVVYCRCQILDDWKGIRRGPDWWKQIPTDVRKLVQEAYNICSVFDDPDDNPMVKTAFRNFFRRSKPLTLGKYLTGKKEFTAKAKDVITGVRHELNFLIKKQQQEQELERQSYLERAKQVLVDPLPIKQYNKKKTPSFLDKIKQIEQNG
jgi:hypothetical protein